jgi:hypothetical protein
MKKYSPEIQRLLTSIVDHIDQEDRGVREMQLRNWKQLKLFWSGFSRIWYSSTAHDWRIWDQDNQDSDTNQAVYDKPVNVFKAYLESIIAALSIVVPPVKCFPDDADNTLDLATANAGDKIGQLIFRHNDASLLWLHSLFIYCTEGMTAGYTGIRTDKEFGTYKQKQYEDVEEQHEYTSCSICKHLIQDRIVSNDNTDPNNPLPNDNANSQDDIKLQKELVSREKDEINPEQDDVELDYNLLQGKELCPSCMQMMDPELQIEKFTTTRLVGEIDQPKSRVEMHCDGGLYIKVPIYARCQAECGYLQYSYEGDYLKALEENEDLDHDTLIKTITAKSAGSYDVYDSWARLSPAYQGAYPDNVVTTKHTWIRPWMFNYINDEKDRNSLKKKFPFGVKVTHVNSVYACAEPDALDDRWTLDYNPLADYVHYDPLGMLLTSIQEITNDLISLVLQTIEHGIGMTYADPAVLDFTAFGQTEVTPGGVFPATPKSGKSLADGFHEIKTAQLSGEVMPFQNMVQSLGQLASGALPSLFGGAMQGQGETASEYSMSRSQALQRLQNIWKTRTIWWKNMFGKAIPMYIKEVAKQGGEKDVKLNSDGKFINILINKAELEGKIGRVELEANENLPLTFNQIKDVIEKLLTAQIPEMQAIMADPENIPKIKEYLGLVDISVPGEDDRTKQYDEIKLLLDSSPIPSGVDEMGQPVEAASVEIDPIYDDHEIHFKIVKKWVTSEVGQQTKVSNEEGYKNVLLHGQMHLQQIQMNMQMQTMIEPTNDKADKGDGANPKKPNTYNRKAPIGESNVPVSS